ncbi:hypothetical protein, partial [Providencia manganoxydans]|uniref:hypothetical protein n=1 Tax=Providencia manganoxydans TaxID=2923283 RepID=UPI0034E5799C
SLRHLCCSEVSISPLFRWPNLLNHYIPISIGLMSEGKDFISIFIAFNGCIVAAIILVWLLHALLKWID